MLTAKSGKRKREYIHRLVALAFIPNPLGLPQVNHKDLNRVNNNVDNLEWCSVSENIKHSYTANKERGRGGCKIGDGPNKQQCLCVESGEVFESISEAARVKGLQRTNISACINGKQRTCGGYHWEYYDGRDKS